MERHREYLRVQREKQNAASLPAAVADKAIAQTKPLKSELTDFATRLALVQSALVMALEGVSRATVSSVCQRALSDFGVYVMPSLAGQVFTGFGVRRVTSHGQNRLVLDEEKLKPLQERLSLQFEEMVPEVESAIKKFEGVADVVGDLESRMSAVYRQAEREQQIRDYVIKYQRDARDVDAWERKYREVRSQVQRREELQEAIKDLRKKVKSLPDLEERQAKLESQVAEHEAAEKEVEAEEQQLDGGQAALAGEQKALEQRKQELDAREKELLGSWRRYDVREGVIEIGEVQKELKAKRKELDGVLRQLGEKKGLLSRALGREKSS